MWRMTKEKEGKKLMGNVFLLLSTTFVRQKRLLDCRTDTKDRQTLNVKRIFNSKEFDQIILYYLLKRLVK